MPHRTDQSDKPAKKRRKKAAAGLLLLLFLLICASFTAIRLLSHAARDYYEARYLSFDFANDGYDYTESAAILDNPGGGYYYLRGYLLSDDLTDEDLDALLERDIGLSEDQSLVLLEINLLRYNDRALSDTALSQVDRILRAWQDADFQIILRFVYDWDGNAAATEPSDIALVKTHMTQTAPIVNSCAASIYTMQGIFVGNYGEMHGSNHMDEKSMCALMAHLASVIDPEIFLAVRTPAQRRTILSSAEAFPAGNALAERLGLFNDGMLGSDIDLGTYGDVDKNSSSSLSDRWLREQELEYQSELCRRVPNGGEVTIDNPYNDLENAISDLSAMHVSYLNCMYHLDVLDKWKAGTVKTDDDWDGTDGYTYIGAHLSCRYFCSGTAASDFHFWTDDDVQLSLTLTNTGFSGSYEPLTMRLLVVADTDGAIVLDTALENSDFLTLSCGESMDASITLPLREYPDGAYRICLSCTRDSDGRRIALAGKLPLTDYGYELASFSIDRTPIGTPSAEELLKQYLSHLRESEKSLAK